MQRQTGLTGTPPDQAARPRPGGAVVYDHRPLTTAHRGEERHVVHKMHQRPPQGVREHAEHRSPPVTDLCRVEDPYWFAAGEDPAQERTLPSTWYPSQHYDRIQRVAQLPSP